MHTCLYYLCMIRVLSQCRMFGIPFENIWQLSPICIYVSIADVQFVEDNTLIESWANVARSAFYFWTHMIVIAFLNIILLCMSTVGSKFVWKTSLESMSHGSQSFLGRNPTSIFVTYGGSWTSTTFLFQLIISTFYVRQSSNLTHASLCALCWSSLLLQLMINKQQTIVMRKTTSTHRPPNPASLSLSCRSLPLLIL